MVQQNCGDKMEYIARMETSNCFCERKEKKKKLKQIMQEKNPENTKNIFC